MLPPGCDNIGKRSESVSRLEACGSNAAIKFLILCIIMAVITGLATWKIFQISAAGGSSGQLFWLFLTGSLCLYGSYVFARVWWVLSRQA